jgi:phospholipase/carboxylesterase
MLQQSVSSSSIATSVMQPRASSKSPIAPKTIDLPFPFRLFVPEAYERNYAYPLVVWLHSDASSEMELDGVMESLSCRNYISIAPRANVRSRGEKRRFRWGSSLTDCAVAEDLVWNSVCAVSESLSVNLNRVFLAGFGGGGTMAQWIGLKYAPQVAGVVSIQGSYPKAPRSLSSWKQARKLKSLFIQSQGSTICNDEDMATAIKIAHQSGLQYRFVQSQSDNSESDANALDGSMLEVANRFMMGIVTGTDIPLSPEPVANDERFSFGSN